MKQAKRILSLSVEEYRLTLYGLLHFRNKLIGQGRYPDAVNELLVKLQRAMKAIYPDLNGIGHSYGMGKFADADRAFDVYQILRYALGDPRELFQFGEPLPCCTRV